MGSGSSVVRNLTDEEELTIYRDLKEKCDTMLALGESDESVFANLRETYEQKVSVIAQTAPASPSNRIRGASADAEGAAHGMILIGDIVRAQPPDDHMMFEGVIIDIRVDAQNLKTYQVDFGDEDEEAPWCENVQRMFPWHTMEVGDRVRAKPLDEANYYDAHVVGHNADGTFEVLIEGDDESFMLPASNVIKHSSNRTAMVKFQKAIKKVMTLNYMKQLAHQDGKDDR